MRKRVLITLLTLLIVVATVLSTVAIALPRQSFPQITGDIHLDGLDDPVDIYRDSLGIPHIYAATQHDLFFAEGYVHAQDRFWQMDFWRHIGSGRLAEMFGKSQLETDIFLRTLGWARVAQQELDQIDPESKAILDDYTAGVNAYLKDHQGAALSLEYSILKLTNPGYRPEPWTPLHSLTWAKAMAWDLRGNMDEEGQSTKLLKTFTKEQVDELYPPYPQDHPLIVQDQAVSGQPADPRKETPVSAIPLSIEQLNGFKRQETALDQLVGPGGPSVGSNNWVISGKLTTTGKPLLANDPHLGSQMPSIWYEIGLHCQVKNAACPFVMTGFSFPGAPGIIIGHNDRIAWGFTNVGPDVQDIYIEKLNPYQPNQYEVNGRWEDMRLVKETIQVAGDQPVEITVRYTRHGPLLWDDQESADEFRLKSGVELPVSYGLALRWTALEVSHTFPAMWKIDQAQNWEEFRAAASEFDVPAQNFVYADVDGNIGYQMPGKIPIRAGGDGRYYVPGWIDDYEWKGYIPFEQLPSILNPSSGYIATANNAVAGSEYPYLISTDWDLGFRAQRINDLIRNAPSLIDIRYIEKMQGDDYNMNVDSILPVLMSVRLEDARLENARALLKDWDHQQEMSSPQAALYEVFWKNLLARTFTSKLPEDMQPDGGSRWYEVMRRLVQEPDSGWWDDPATETVTETRDDIFRQSFASAVVEIEKLQGSDPARWKWGSLHTLTFRNKTLGESGIAPIEALFNRGPYQTSGGEGIINATGWTAPESFEVNWLPSMRMIVDLADLDRSQSIHTTGQSGHAYHPHYVDMADLWRNIQYHPMRWSKDSVQSGAEGRLRLLP